MTFKTIIVHCDADKSATQRVAVASDLAAEFDSQLVGLHVRPPFEPPAFFDGNLAMDQLVKAYEENLEADQTVALSAFAKGTANKNIAVERRVVDGIVDREIIRRSRYADLVILGQDHEGAPAATPSDLPEVVAMASGRPVLVVPYIDVHRPIGRNVMICWNAGREAARAASDALPLLKRARRVTVFSNSADEEEAGAAAAVAWLGRHGVSATAIVDKTEDVDTGEGILSRAADLDADLIVMGIYGHARMREMVLGGVSRTLLNSMTIPVLMAH